MIDTEVRVYVNFKTKKSSQIKELVSQYFFEIVDEQLIRSLKDDISEIVGFDVYVHIDNGCLIVDKEESTNISL